MTIVIMSGIFLIFFLFLYLYLHEKSTKKGKIPFSENLKSRQINFGLMKEKGAPSCSKGYSVRYKLFV